MCGYLFVLKERKFFICGAPSPKHSLLSQIYIFSLFFSELCSHCFVNNIVPFTHYFNSIEAFLYIFFLSSCVVFCCVLYSIISSPFKKKKFIIHIDQLGYPFNNKKTLSFTYSDRLRILKAVMSLLFHLSSDAGKSMAASLLVAQLPIL